MLNVALFEPEIPPNTGNIMRLCANTGATLHLVEPLGFSLDERQLRRAGLDYREFVDVKTHASLDALRDALSGNRFFGMTTKAARSCYEQRFEEGDVLLFGPESRGLPAEVLSELGGERLLRIPMVANSRSLNLSNAVSVVLYEGLRQLGFGGLQ